MIFMQRLASYVRLFLQFIFADLAVYTLSLIIIAFISYRPSRWRDGACEALPTQPDLVRSLSQAGFDLENCESWIERLVTSALTVLCVGLMIKVCQKSTGADKISLNYPSLLQIQFIVAITSFYSTFARGFSHSGSVFPSIAPSSTSSSTRTHARKASVSRRQDRHILLVPANNKRGSLSAGPGPSSDLPPYSDRGDRGDLQESPIAIYAPVTHLTPEDARALNAKDALVSVYEMDEHVPSDAKRR
jgi:hypothetical protein